LYKSFLYTISRSSKSVSLFRIEKGVKYKAWEHNYE
jgi:hypothetical protein